MCGATLRWVLVEKVDHGTRREDPAASPLFVLKHTQQTHGPDGDEMRYARSCRTWGWCCGTASARHSYELRALRAQQDEDELTPWTPLVPRRQHLHRCSPSFFIFRLRHRYRVRGYTRHEISAFKSTARHRVRYRVGAGAHIDDSAPFLPVDKLQQNQQFQ
ncbi:hypothetical protein B0H12DRAFT_1068033 [Mycena haematopus]|nr:hypothetical protein B0H12DRAFT_1068033 [Mycena haematopus]